jgi:hypothetical protein
MQLGRLGVWYPVTPLSHLGCVLPHLATGTLIDQNA